MGLNSLIILLCVATGLFSNSVLAMDKTEEGGPVQISQSYRPPTIPQGTTPERTYPEYVAPSGFPCFDPDRNLMVYSKTCSIVCPLMENSYLTAESEVKENSYQWAKFTSRESFTDQSRPGSVFKILEDEATKTCRIQCNHGATSYLAVDSSNDDSFRWALFASEGYLEANPGKYCSQFTMDFSGLDYIGIKFPHWYSSLSLYLTLNTPFIVGTKWAAFEFREHSEFKREYSALKLYTPLVR